MRPGLLRKPGVVALVGHREVNSRGNRGYMGGSSQRWQRNPIKSWQLCRIWSILSFIFVAVELRNFWNPKIGTRSGCYSILTRC